MDRNDLAHHHRYDTGAIDAILASWLQLQPPAKIVEILNALRLDAGRGGRPDWPSRKGDNSESTSYTEITLTAASFRRKCPLVYGNAPMLHG